MSENREKKPGDVDLEGLSPERLKELIAAAEEKLHDVETDLGEPATAEEILRASEELSDDEREKAIFDALMKKLSPMNTNASEVGEGILLAKVLSPLGFLAQLAGLSVQTAVTEAGKGYKEDSDDNELTKIKNANLFQLLKMTVKDK